MINRLRLTSGCVLFTFLVCHLLNHTAGLVSIGLMNGSAAWLTGPWRSWPGTLVLAGALTVHATIALRSLVSGERRFRRLS